MKKIFALIIFCIPFLLFSLPSAKSLYEKAISKKFENEFVPIFKELSENYSQTIYGQKALLELAKIEFLKRNYDLSLSYLKKINNPKIKETAYWLAKVYLKLNKNIEAIYSAQNYIYLDTQNYEKVEDMLLTIAEAFLQKKIYYRALSTLNSLRKSKYATNRLSLIVFKTAECYEKMGKIEKAIKIYKKMKIDFPYDEYTYIAQDKVFELTSLEDIRPKEDNAKKKLDKAAVSPKDFELYLQAGAYGKLKMAKIQEKKIASYGIKTKIGEKTKRGKKLYIVYAGPFNNTAEMKKASSILRENGIEFFIYKKYRE